MNSLDLPIVSVLVKYQICAMCSEKKDYKTLYEENLKTIDLLEFRIEQMHLKDSCYSMLDSYKETENSKRDFIALLEKPCNPFLTKDCVMVTLTFDPKMFPVLINRTAQRDYIRYKLNEFIELFEIDELYGCYELHDSGIVHSHFVVEKLDIHQYSWLTQQFTRTFGNKTAVHRCDKKTSEATDYINKSETKDRNNMQNYFRYRKPHYDYEQSFKKLPTQEQLYEKFKNNNYII